MNKRQQKKEQKQKERELKLQIADDIKKFNDFWKLPQSEMAKLLEISTYLYNQRINKKTSAYFRLGDLELLKSNLEIKIKESFKKEV